MAPRNSYRPRVETSLELKCLVLFGLSLLVVISVSFWLYWQVTQEVVNDQNPRTGRILVDQVMILEHRAAFEIDPRFPAFMQDLDSQLSRQKYESRIITPPPPMGEWPSESKPADTFEQEILRRFLETPTDAAPSVDFVDRIVLSGGSEIYQYYQAIRAPSPAETTCIACHRGFGRRDLVEGDLMAVVGVAFPNEAKDTIRWSWAWLLCVAIVTAFLALVAFYIVVRYLIIRPLRHLRDVSDAISRGGDLSQRAEIHTGDEFEALAVAFNRMLRHLTAIQDELRAANADLDNNVDQLAQANVQLYEMNRIKSDFMATMSHELRTPLNSILGFSDVLGSIDTLTEKQKRYVQNINKSGRLLLSMINDVLDLAKIEAGRMEVRLSEFAVAPLVGAQCDMARPLSDRKKIDIEVDVEPELPPMRQDESRVQQIMNNLLSNAIKFTPEGGRVVVIARREPRLRPVKERDNAAGAFDLPSSEDAGELVLKVRDTGIGIAPDDQQIIFEKFRQGRTAMPGGDAMTREHSGSGLGLSIVKEICRLLGGSIAVESELGTGSTFTVRLPWRLREQPKLEPAFPQQFDDFARMWKIKTTKKS